MFQILKVGTHYPIECQIKILAAVNVFHNIIRGLNGDENWLNHQPTYIQQANCWSKTKHIEIMVENEREWQMSQGQKSTSTFPLPHFYRRGGRGCFYYFPGWSLNLQKGL